MMLRVSDEEQGVFVWRSAAATCQCLCDVIEVKLVRQRN